MMETGGLVKKPTLTPKSIINQKYGDKANYVVEEVKQESPQSGSLSLAIPQNGPCLYRCRLELPEVTVVSEAFIRKKEAEQSAAEMALQKLGIHPDSSTPTMLNAEAQLDSRLAYIFSCEVSRYIVYYLDFDITLVLQYLHNLTMFLSSLHPLCGHLKATLQREGELCGLVPAAVLIACDSKLTKLCKSINPSVESNPFLALDIVMEAASRLPELVAIADNQLCLRRHKCYPPEIIQEIVNQQSDETERKVVEAIFIPCSYDLAVRPLSLNIGSRGYYLDVIAEELAVADASNLLLSRTIGRASSDIRLYVSALEKSNFTAASVFQDVKGGFNIDGPLNVRASYLSSQEVYGDAVLASIGYKWKSGELVHEDLFLRHYFRFFVSKTPVGIYKFSRGSFLTADLPTKFTRRTNWRGALPRDILSMFCRHHRLSEPILSTVSNSVGAGEESVESCKKLRAGEGAEVENEGIVPTQNKESDDSERSFRCEVKLYSKQNELILECYPKEWYKRQSDAVYNAALRVVSWLNAYFKQMDVHLELLASSADALDICCHLSQFSKEFSLCQLIQSLQCQSRLQQGSLFSAHHQNQSNFMIEVASDNLNIEGPDSGVPPVNGSVVSIKYMACLVVDGEQIKEVLESYDGFEFEIGTGAVDACVEAALMQITTGQSVRFNKDLPPQELILAAATDSEKVISILSAYSCCLEFDVILLHVNIPLEDRMEQALFSPPLSKQRLLYALQHIKESSATSLIDFGCGSGSLLDALLDCPSTLEKIVGIDISQKGLVRAAKALHSKLSKLEAVLPRSCIKSAVLYEGSITIFDSRAYGFDIGTCLEVIEHMEEDQASLFGDVVLGSFRPRILIISTPNFEYNVILQKSNLPCEDDFDEPVPSSCRFRNHDHKFEWTRKQFNSWASGLARRHNYEVEFSGVGGSGRVEPGFASQIAVFRRKPQEEPEECGNEDSRDYKVLWEWNAAGA